jgi:hypothetical protein
MIRKFKFTIQRWLQYEYWSVYVFYLPFIPVWLYYSIRSLDFLYFTRVNPSVLFGGFLQYSKYGILKHIDPKYTVQSFFFNQIPSDNSLPEGLEFPFIYKPDIGERGKDVRIIKSLKEWEAFFPTIKDAYILQEFCDYQTELGILFHRIPGQEAKVTSIVRKGFLEVVGDGKSTLKELTENHIRAYKNIDLFAERFSEQWNVILPKNESFVLEKIGNHCKGTTFLDDSHKINKSLQKVIDEITEGIPEFYYGRFDLKVSSYKDLYQGKNIKIFELNGVNSEVAHIYDPKHNLWYAYKTIFKELQTVFRIVSILKDQKNAEKSSISEFCKALIHQYQ